MLEETPNRKTDAPDKAHGASRPGDAAAGFAVNEEFERFDPRWDVFNRS